MLDLGKIRNEIDQTDAEILRLFERRMELTSEVAEYKIQTGKPVFDPEREISKLQKLGAAAHTEFNARGIQEIFRQVMSISRKRQYQLLDAQGSEASVDYEQVDELPCSQAKVIFQGVEGAYSFEAMNTFFGSDIESDHVATFKEAMKKVADREADYAVLPIENSTAGIVQDIYDLMAEYPVYIVGEQVIRIDHKLMGIPGTDLSHIRKVYSHPQGLAQCQKFLEQYDWEQEAVLNTAVAAQKVADEQDACQAAIASSFAARHFGLQVLLDEPMTGETNATRFVIISNQKRFVKTAGKISINFEIPHESGSLYNTLSHFIYNDLNMTKIESRPIPGRNWEYRFFLDFEGNLSEAAVKNALRGLDAETSYLRILGNY